MIKFYLNFTTSKLFAYIIFVVGCIYSFIYQDATVFITITSLSAGLLGLKNWSEYKLNHLATKNTVSEGDIPPTPQSVPINERNSEIG